MQGFDSTARVRRIKLPTPFPVGAANVYLVFDDALTLVDVGAKSDEAFTALEAGLTEAGVAWRDIERVLITHGHLDHIGMLGRVLEATGAQSYAHPYVLEQWRAFEDDLEQSNRYYLEMLTTFGAPVEEARLLIAARAAFQAFGDPVRVEHALADGEAVGALQAHYVPGHSPSDTLFLDEDTRWIFSGDHLLKNVRPNPLLRRPKPGEPRAKSLIECMASLEKTRALAPEGCYPGHGPVFDNPVAVADRLLERIEERTERVYQLLGHDTATPYTLMGTLFPALDKRALHMGLSVVVGHLDVLEERGQVVCERRDGLCYYTRIG